MSGIAFDPEKDARNVARHGLSLADFSGFDEEATVQVDDRRDYGETRFIARGRIGGVPHAVIFTWRGETMRLISFRRAREKELRRHGQA